MKVNTFYRYRNSVDVYTTVEQSQGINLPPVYRYELRISKHPCQIANVITSNTRIELYSATPLNLGDTLQALRDRNGKLIFGDADRIYSVNTVVPEINFLGLVDSYRHILNAVN